MEEEGERGGGSVEKKPSYRRFSATKEQVGTGLKTLCSKISFDLLEITSGDLSISVTLILQRMSGKGCKPLSNN